MLRLVFSKRFERDLRLFLKKHPDLKAVVWDKFLLLQKNQRDARLEVHKLTGKLKGFLAASITYEYRVVFSLEKDAVYLLAIGTHDEVY